MRQFSQNLLLISLALFLVTSTSYAEEYLCRPACEPIEACSKAGVCLAACDPICGEDEKCYAGRCVPKKKELSFHQTLSLMAGPIVQIASGDKIDTARGGLGLAFRYVLGAEMHALLVEPRLNMVFGNKISQPELGFALGYRYRLAHKSIFYGFRTALAMSFWFNTEESQDSVAFFALGLQSGPFLRYKNWIFSMPIEVAMLPRFNPTVGTLTITALGGYTF